MSRLRSSMVLLGICVAALLIGGLRLATEHTPLPVGSSYSTEPGGAQGLYEWAAAVGSTPVRIQDASLPEGAVGQVPTTLLVLQPETPLDPAAQVAFDAVPGHGGSLVIAGDSIPWLLYARAVGVAVDPVGDTVATASTPDGTLSMNVIYRFRLRSDGATPLLVAANGDVIGIRMPYKQGSLVVLSTPAPLTNAGLANPQAARFVYRQILSSSPSGPPLPLAFDEAHHSFAPPSVGPTTLNQLLFDTAVGRAIGYTVLLVFAFLLLSGRRLGPPLPARPPTETRRTMYEHVRMLADLYRRAGQFAVVRRAFGERYKRELARAVLSSPKRVAALSTALARVETARTTAELIAAVTAAEDS
jgi:hypothetical protein